MSASSNSGWPRRRSRMNEKRLIYKKTAMEKFMLSKFQIEQAIEQKILKNVKRIRNPHYSSAPPSLLLDEEEIQKNLEKIRPFPRFSEGELKKIKTYRKRSMKVSKISFFCPLCQKNIRPLLASYTRDAVLKGIIDYESARAIVIVTHFRHVHTDYDKIKHDQSLQAMENFKNQCTNKAIELAKENRLLDITKKRYDTIAGEIKETYLLP